MRKNWRLLRKICRFAYFRWRLLLCVCAAAAVLTAVAVTAFAAEDLNPHVEDLKLLSNNQPVEDGDSLSLNAILSMRYQLWDIHVETLGSNTKLYFYDSATTWEQTPIDIDMDYELTLPEYLACAASFSDISIQAGGVRIATVSYVDAHTVKLKFDADLPAEAAGHTHIQSTEFSFSATLDEVAVGQRNEVTIDLGNGQTLTVEIAENTPLHAALTNKACSNLAGEPKLEPTTGHFHWTVTIDPEVPVCDASGTPVYTEGYVFRDALGSAQTYVPGSFEITWARSTPVTEARTPTVNAENNSFEYTFTGTDEVLDAQVTITYETAPVDGLFYDAGTGQMVDPSSVDINNTATLYMPGTGGAAINSKSGTAEYEGEDWLVKAGGEIDRLNRTITWTLTVNTNGRGFNYIKVYDAFGGGADPGGAAYLEYVPDSLTVDGVSRPAAAGFNGHDQNLLYELNDPTALEYVIQYKTEFPNISLDDNLSKNVSNSAWLDFEWKTGHGPGPGTDYGIPTINKPVSLGASIVAKGGAYNPATRQIKWTVTVNANRLDVAGATITDTLTLTNQKRPLASPAPAAVCKNDGTVAYTINMTERGTSGVYDLVLKRGGTGGDNALGTDTVEITYYTEATDPAFYANNATATFHNTATVENIALTNDPQGLPGPFSATANPTGTSRVMDKQAVGYNYVNNQIEWELTVNANNMRLKNATVTDVLPSYLSFVPNSATYTPAGAYAQPTESGNTLTFSLGDLSGQLTINFKVQLDVNATNLPGGFLFGRSNTADGITAPLSIANAASLATNEYPNASVTEQDDIEIFNTLLDKQGAQDAATGRVQYTVELNQNGADLSLSYPDGVFLTDELPPSLFVDLEDVHLYEATVDASTGAFTGGAEVPLTYQQKRLVQPNNLQVTLPVTDRPYILTYDAYINLATGGPVTLTNQAGFGVDGKSGGKTITTPATASSGGSASLLRDKSALTIKKTDANDPQLPLAGAVYGLYAPIPNSSDTYLYQIATTAIDANGDASATFIGLTPSRVYTLRELTAPAGYTVAAPVTVTAGAAQTVLELLVQDVKQTDEPIPNTGDGSMPLLWAGLALLSAAGLCIFHKKRKT